MPESSAKPFSGIFVSYRREDSSGHAGRLFDRLAAHFGKDRIFMDIDTIEPGEDFVTIIEEAVSSCDILIAIIGRQWLKSASQNTSRLDNPHDFVRLEIATALNRDIRVIPVLVQRASMPTAQDLPDDLAKFSRRNAIELSDLRWQSEVDQLIAVMERVLAKREQQRQAAEARRAEDERKSRDKQLEQVRLQDEALRAREAEETARRDAANRQAQEEEEERRQREAGEAAARRVAEEKRIQEAAEKQRREKAEQEAKEKLRLSEEKEGAEREQQKKAANAVTSKSSGSPAVEKETATPAIATVTAKVSQPAQPVETVPAAFAEYNQPAGEQASSRRTALIVAALVVLIPGLIAIWSVTRSRGSAVPEYPTYYSSPSPEISSSPSESVSSPSVSTALNPTPEPVASPTVYPNTIRLANGNLQPANGYDWVNSGNQSDFRVKLKEGLSKNAEGNLEPAIGYDWVNSNDPADLRVKLKPGLVRHGNNFDPAPGYRWVNSSDPNDLRVERIP